jgi:hypothetical protein
MMRFVAQASRRRILGKVRGRKNHRRNAIAADVRDRLRRFAIAV